MKNCLILALLSLLLAALPALAQTGSSDSVAPMSEVTLHIDKADLDTLVAATSAQQERGLMWVKSMPDNEGMIFLLPTVTTATFWMRNTLIPLSVAFIDKNGTILEIHDMQPADPSLPDNQVPITSGTGPLPGSAYPANTLDTICGRLIRRCIRSSQSRSP